jgi:NAD(P)-dependent dehydrogenase (short-subunit alcohol dehydrogenase family)
MASRFGWSGASLDEASLIAAARKQTGLHYFGDDTFRVPLRVQLRSIEQEADLHPIGRAMARYNMIRTLANRLRIQHLLDTFPEILELELEDPIVIAGLQRTGTTVIHRLLASDPNIRALASWEAINPAPLGELAGGRADPRIKAARLAEQSVTYLAPDFFAVHPIEHNSPEEDVLILDYSLLSTVPEATLRVPTFSKWLETQDQRPAYRFLKRAMQLLSWQRPGGRWVLKSPHHLENLDALFAVFPQAQVIQTHRDPVVALASFCSMMAHARGMFTDRVDARDIGAHWSAKTGRMIERSLAVRREREDQGFIDVSYQDIVADPVAQMCRIYDFIGRDLDDEVERRMRGWLGSNRQHKHGRHRYQMQEFGLDRAREEQKFSEYIERFQIPLERREGEVSAPVSTGEPPLLAGRGCLVTGATSGHGYAVARGLAQLGASLVLLGRDLHRCRRVQEEIAAEFDCPRPEILLCDLSSRQDIDRAAQEFLDRGTPIHVMVNNAGGVFQERQTSPDGVEMTIAVNYLAMYQLTLRLLPRILESAPARIVNIASDAHMIATLDPDDLEANRRRRYWFLEAYGRSKLAIIYFTRELARRLEVTSVTANSLDPGPVESKIGQNNPGLTADLLVWVMKYFFPSAEQAAQTAIMVASSPEIDGISGLYYRSMKEKSPKLAADDAEVGRRLWDVSARMTGVDWP